MKNAFVNINGSITPAAEAKISVFDRGFLYGDSIYEVVRSYEGRFYGLEEHLDRLQRSAALCRMILAQTHEQLKAEIDRTFRFFRERFPKDDAYCRIIITRGVGEIGFGLEKILTPSQMILIVQPVEAPSDATRSKGIALQIVDRLRNAPRALDPAMKSGNYLNCVLAYLEAAADGYADALLCDADGNVTEGTTFNVFYVRNNVLVTPPLGVGILEGITRAKVMVYARELGIEVREVLFPASRLVEADEVFITGTVKEVLAVTSLNGKKVGKGSPGPITEKLFEAYRKGIEIWLHA